MRGYEGALGRGFGVRARGLVVTSRPWIRGSFTRGWQRSPRRGAAPMEGEGALLQINSGISDQLVRQREASTLYRHLRSMRLKTFSSHSAMCRALHAAIRVELGVEVTPQLCVTSLALGEEEPDLADAFDAISLDPVGLRYQVWLETRKPVNLRPDVCSLKLYARHEDVLRAYVMKGSEPDPIDQKLRDAA